ncbi:hypothetical protein B0A79_22655 [Flavobacterium piscis]|uniref:Uncharacterized protein n=1 Tax=Flavobacterium piscis TaxID=1114874 RepID=A0ABX2XGE5_9FLAO|nr:hypothetical protein [Flavobacterium piscis]OCB71198.1 hypothetical protein FLP_16940 [Flavobacterium piscis]OXE96636.1 hypothetical protein B0A79_22655 [Flavobacterium piscis]
MNTKKQDDMKRYIAYFDFLGYKEFILNNDSTYLKGRVIHILRDIEMALGQGKYHEPENGRILSDTSQTRINCLNISDTVIFWTNDDSIESLEELLIVAHRFNWQEILYNFPIRGVIYCDELEMISGKKTNTVGSIYSANMIYGKGLANAHIKGDNLNWSGSVIDHTVIENISDQTDIVKFLEPFAKLYKVPYKKPYPDIGEEYALHINKGKLNQEAFENTKKGIEATFKSDNKTFDHPRVQEILANTIKYLETYKE